MQFWIKSLPTIFVFAGILSGCAQPIDIHGNRISLKSFETIEPGKTTEQQVLEQLGKPVVTQGYGSKSSIYVESKSRKTVLSGRKFISRTIVRVSFDNATETADITAMGTLRLLEAMRHVCPDARFYQASSSEMFGDKIIPEQSDKIDLKKLVAEADLIVGGVLIPGAEAPKLVTKDMLKLMKRGSVIVDVAIDQGGCVETSKPTTHGDPTYIVNDVVHYCVANMPGGVPRTSTFALNKATLPYLVKLANKGYQKALGEDKNFLAGLNVHKGHVTYKAVADVFGHEYVSAGEAIKN